MARTCQCWKTYQCLLCEDVANGRVVIVEDKVVRVVRSKGNRTTSTLRAVAECGTRSGYKRHRANGEEACAECKSAQNEAVKKYMRERASK
jgi:hypothetical protein